MILVYTPGRVGTCSIHDTLKRHVKEEIISLHAFTPNESLDGLPDENIDIEKGKVKEILKEVSSKRRVRAVTAVRDPMERAISSFSFFRIHYPETNYGELDCFLSQYNFDWYLDWFDSEIKSFFGLDVYEGEFPYENNWQCYTGSNISLIVLKFPHLSALQEAADICWKIKLGPVIKNNMIHCKPNRVKGYMELKNSKFPKDLVDRIYDSQFVKYFWTPEEIADFKTKWSE